MHWWIAWLTPRGHCILQDWSSFWLSPNMYSSRRYPQDCLPDLLWPLQIPGTTFWTDQCTSNLHSRDAYCVAPTPWHLCDHIHRWYSDIFEESNWTLTTPGTSTQDTLSKSTIWETLQVRILQDQGEFSGSCGICQWHRCRTSQDWGYTSMAHPIFTHASPILPGTCKLLLAICSQLLDQGNCP